ncbi:MAG: hypothetical protein QXX07_00825 [Candidatus Aenigmatarchaeota archaeon]
MQTKEKVLLILGLLNFLVFVQGLALKIPDYIRSLPFRIPEQRPELISAMQMFTPFEVSIQLLVFFFFFITPGFIFTLAFFKELTKLEKIFLSFTISTLIFGIFDNIGAGMLGSMNYYSICSTTSLIFIVAFSVLGLFFLYVKKIGLGGKLFKLIFIVVSIIFFLLPLLILKNIEFGTLLEFEKIIPWWFNPPCICSEVNFLVGVGSLLIVLFLLNFVVKLKRELILIPLLLLLGFVFFSSSKFLDTYHGMLSFSSPTFLVWVEDLANKSELLMLISLLILLLLNLEMLRVVRKI